MNTILKILILAVLTIGGLQAQCDLKVNKDAFEGKAHEKLVETHSDLICMKGGVVYSEISNFYDGHPHFRIQVCLKGDHFSISKDDEVNFHMKSGEVIKRNNFIRTGAKKKKVGSGSYRCATYTIPIDDRLKSEFMKGKKECALAKLDFTHKNGSVSFKIKKKYANVLGQHMKCVMEVLEN